MAFNKMDELKGLIEELDGWKTVIDKPNEKIHCESKTSWRGNQMMRVTVECDYSPLTMFRAYCNQGNRLKYDKLVSKIQNLEQLGCNFSLGYQRIRRLGFVSPRDMY